MMIRANKKVSAKKDLEYAALLSGTISNVWHEDDAEEATAPRRVNRIRLTREAGNTLPGERFNA